MNQYLEKIAGNAYKNRLAAKGMNVEGISSQSLVSAIPAAKKPGSFGQMTQAANRIGKAANPKFNAGPKPSLGSRVRQMAGVGPGISAGAQGKLTAMKTQGKTLGQTLQSHVAAKQAAGAAAQGGAKGILGKALGFAKKNPLMAAGGALAAGVGVGSMMGGRKSEPQYGPY